jgi:hypothetical protein
MARIFRLYKTPAATIKVAGCKDCPGKHMQHFKTGGKYSTTAVCKLITLKHNVRQADDTYKEESYHPSVRNEVEMDGCRSDCPLPIMEVK